MARVLHKNRPLTTDRRPPTGFFLFTALLGLVGLLWVVTPAQAQQTVSYADYLALIGRLRGEVQHAGTQESGGCVATLQQVATELEGITAVLLPDGLVMTVNHQGLTAAWGVLPCRTAEAEAYLGGICPTLVCPVNAPAALPGGQIPPLSDIANNLPDGSPPNATFPNQPLNDPATGNPTEGQPLPGQSPDGQPAPDAPGQAPANSDSLQPGDPAGNAPNAEGQPTSNAPAGADQPADGSAEEPGGESNPGEGQTGENGQPGGDTGVPGQAGEPGSDGGETAETGNDPAGQTAATPQPAPGQAPANTAQATPTNSPLTTPETETDQPNWLLWGAAVVGVVVILLVIVLLVRAGRRAKRRTDARRKRSPQEVTPVQAIDEGRQSLAEGDYRTAVRQLFLATLLVLDERGVLRFDRTLTNYELLDQAGSYPGLPLLLKPVVKTFERVWYGFESLATAEYESLVGQIEALREPPGNKIVNSKQ